MTVIKIPHINKAIREHGLKVEVIERRSNSYLNPIDGDPSSLEYSGTG